MFDLIVIDVGNTNTSIAYIVANNIKKIEHKKTKYISSRIKLLPADRIVISSVVPSVTEVFLRKHPLADVINLDKLGNNSFPKNIGIDRAINCLSAMSFYKAKNVLVIDMGTALTFSCCINSKFAGGLIMPGYGLSKSILYSKTAQLPEINNNVYAGLFNSDTQKAMQAGIFKMYKSSIDELIEEYRKSNNEELIVVLTGGDSLLFKDYFKNIDVVNPTLLLEGIVYISGLL